MLAPTSAPDLTDDGAPEAPPPPFRPTRRHHQRLRAMYRSSGWPCQDMLEVELLAAGLLERVTDPLGRDTLRLTPAGIAELSCAHAGHRAARSAHETLVEHVQRAQTLAGRLAWRGLSLRAPVPVPTDPARTQWVNCCPDVFSIRNTSVESYAQPVVHEIKVSRADLLGDLRNAAKRASYLALSSECWYVLSCRPDGHPIAAPNEIPLECGVMAWRGDGLEILRPAPQRAVERLSFHLWMALARAGQPATPEEGLQASL